MSRLTLVFETGRSNSPELQARSEHPINGTSVHGLADKTLLPSSIHESPYSECHRPGFSFSVAARSLVTWSTFAVTTALPVSIEYPTAQKWAEIFRLERSIHTSIILPNDPAYTAETTQRWTTWEAPSFIAAIKPTSEGEIASVIKLCANHDIPFLVTGGGHGAGTGYGSVKRALNIDLGNFRDVDLNAGENLLTVGGATQAGQIYQPLYQAGKELPTGRSHCVGLVGLTLGGGIGTLQGKHGLVMDSLLSVRMVTAQGETVTVSKQDNPDLFWALRGAGANFGIVTSALYKVYDAANGGQFVNADFEYDGSNTVELWRLLESLDDDMTSELSIVLGCGYNRQKKEPILIANVVYSGTLQDALPHLVGFAACKPTRSSISTVPWPELSSVAQFGFESMACNRHQFVSVYTIGLNSINVDTLETVFREYMDFYSKNPGFEGRFGFQKYSNKVTMAVGVPGSGDESVYPWRNIKTQVLFRNMQTDRSLDGAVDALTRSLRSRLESTSGFDRFQPYINYAHGDESPEDLYGPSNLPRLVELKRKWDPQNLFGKGFPVPLAL
ncbi:hypothetical protein F5Y19DRAFT_491330 [Xylariaceae sp. FL1651]|nr:hypothetical protein F5Y19DRAFT_491330 [Xylariaceae sp. FL1651]